MARNIERGSTLGQKYVHHLAAASKAEEHETKKPYVEPKWDKEKM